MSNDYYELDDKDLDDKINESKDEYIKHLHRAIREQGSSINGPVFKN